MDLLTAFASFKPEVQKTIGITAIASLFWFLLIYFYCPGFFNSSPLYIIVMVVIAFTTIEVGCLSYVLLASEIDSLSDNALVRFASVISIVLSTLLLSVAMLGEEDSDGTGIWGIKYIVLMRFLTLAAVSILLYILSFIRARNGLSITPDKSESSAKIN